MFVGDEISLFGNNNTASSAYFCRLLLNISWSVHLRRIFYIEFYVFAYGDVYDRFFCRSDVLYKRGLQRQEIGFFDIVYFASHAGFHRASKRFKLIIGDSPHDKASKQYKKNIENNEQCDLSLRHRS